MPLTIKSIKNLTQSQELPDLNISLDDSILEITNDLTTTMTVVDTDGKLVSFTPSDTDNIEVNYQITNAEGGTKEVREIGGSYKYVGKSAIISGLKPVPKMSMQFYGQLAIGKPLTDKQKPPVNLSVRVGNMSNKHQDWIIDFSDKVDGAPGSSIELTSLIAWIQDKNKTSETVGLPKDAKGPDIKQFLIRFDEFHFNITQKTFNIKVQSEDKSTITFGDFEIMKIGFQITNEPLLALIGKAQEKSTDGSAETNPDA
jgi:hypothetical protein